MSSSLTVRRGSVRSAVEKPKGASRLVSETCPNSPTSNYLVHSPMDWFPGESGLIIRLYIMSNRAFFVL